MAFKWRILLRSAGMDPPLPLLIKLYLASVIAGSFLPSTIGADLFRVWYLGRLGLDRKRVFSSVVVERAVAFAAILILCSISVALALAVRLQGGTLSRAGVAVVFVGLGVLFVFALALRPEVARFLERFERFGLVKAVADILREIRGYGARKRALLCFFCLTFLEQLVPTLSVYLLVRSLSLEIPILDLIIIVPIVTFSMRLPISVDGLGVKEGLFVVLFGTVGVSPAKAFLVSTIDRIVPILCCLPWAIPLLLRGTWKQEKATPS